MSFYRSLCFLCDYDYRVKKKLAVFVIAKRLAWNFRVLVPMYVRVYNI